MTSKTIVVTGASRGIGREIAVFLALKNHKVIAVSRSADLLDDLAQSQPGHIEAYPCDLSSADSIAALTKTLEKKGTPIDGLINNAGALVAKPFLELGDDDWMNMIESNLMSAVRLSRSLIPMMNKGGHIVNVSSLGGFMGASKFGGLSAYSTSKGAMVTLTECLAVELGDRGISANCLCIGAVQTEMLAQAFPGYEAPVRASEMGAYICDFVLNGHKLFNGKVLPVALNDPD